MSFLILSGLIKEQKQDGEIINIAGQQRMLSQRIAMLAASSTLCKDNQELGYLKQDLAKFKQNHEYLVSLEHLPKQTFNTYFQQGQLDSKVKNFVDIAEGLLTNARCETSPLIPVQDLTSLQSAYLNHFLVHVC